MPFNRFPDSYDVTSYGFRSYFSHDKETASPGYYSVFLSDSNIMAELTATQNVGVHRYSYSNTERYILFDIR
jgi:putative alpha-1,2-mannosidase